MDLTPQQRAARDISQSHIAQYVFICAVMVGLFLVFLWRVAL